MRAHDRVVREHNAGVPASDRPARARGGALKDLQRNAGNRAVAGLFTGGLAHTPSLQRTVYLEDEDGTPLHLSRDDVVAELVGEGLVLDQLPGVQEVVSALTDPGVQHTFEYARNLRTRVCNDLMDHYRQAMAGGAPALVTSMEQSRQDGLALLKGLGKFDPTDLFALIRDAQAMKNLDQESLQKEVMHHLSPVDGPNRVLADTNTRDSFLAGRVGQMTGFVGELTAAIDTAAAEPGRSLTMGVDFPLPSRGEARARDQDVDLFFTEGGREHYFEVAANVGVLRDKVQAGGAQKLRYDELMQRKPRAVVGYAVGARRSWPTVFAAGHLPGRLVEFRRSLLVDGTVWSPADITTIGARVDSVYGAYPRDRRRVGSILGEFTAGEFAALDHAMAIRKVGLKLHPRHGSNLSIVAWGRAAVETLGRAVTEALGLLGGFASGDTYLGSRAKDLSEAWIAQQALLVSEFQDMQEHQVDKHGALRVYVKRFRKQLLASRATLDRAISVEEVSGKAAAFRKQTISRASAAYTERADTIEYDKGLSF